MSKENTANPVKIKKAVEIPQALMKKLTALSPTDELHLLKSVTNKFIAKLSSHIQSCSINESILNKIVEVKKAIKEELKRTEYIFINNEKIRIEYNQPVLNETLFFCNKCLKVFYNLKGIKKHEDLCTTFYGNLCYKGIFNEVNEIEIRQIDGALFSRYAHTLTKIGRYFFIDKSLDSLLEYFYLFTLIVNKKLVGYFSMDKLFQNCNISCIVIFPPYRSYKYSYLLIDFSYKIFRLNNKKASPERPLSKGGEIVFLRYWKFVIANFLKTNSASPVNVSMISQATGILEEDVSLTLKQIIKDGFLKEDEIQYIEVLKGDSIYLILEP